MAKVADPVPREDRARAASFPDWAKKSAVCLREMCDFRAFSGKVAAGFPSENATTQED
jgi:hypothetical protein